MKAIDLKSRQFFYIISDVLPLPDKTGGEIVLYRHFEERKDYDYEIIDIPVSYYGLFKTLEASRFRTYIKGFLPFYERVDIESLKYLEKPAFVFTVAHGRACYRALRAALYWNVPLITIFHDWYPASSDVHPSFQILLDLEFRNLYRKSSLALCVSRQMKEALGPHFNSIVLPPISSVHKSINLNSNNSVSIPKLLYAGFCGGAYQGMLNRFMAVKGAEKRMLYITGSVTEGLIQSYENVNILGFVPEQDFASVFEQADILLVFLNFEKRSKKHFSTHFPSKLVEYCGHGKLIAIWGPAYSTAVQWAKETGAAFFYEQNDAEGFTHALFKAFQNDHKRAAYIRQATYIYATQFDPDIVDDQLKKAICKVAGL